MDSRIIDVLPVEEDIPVAIQEELVPTDAVLEKPKMGEYKRHMLVCVGSRCTQNGESESLFQSLAERFKAAGIDSGPLRVKRTRSFCFATCKNGPIVCVQPDGVWYYNVTPANMDRIIQQHFVGGVPVEELIYHRGPSNCDVADCQE